MEHLVKIYDARGPFSEQHLILLKKPVHSKRPQRYHHTVLNLRRPTRVLSKVYHAVVDSLNFVDQAEVNVFDVVITLFRLIDHLL